MLKKLSDDIKHCYDCAFESAKRGAETADPNLKADHEAMEQGWLRLAESYALSQRLRQFLLAQDAKIARRGEWQRIAIAPFDRDLEVAVIAGPPPHAVAFRCRRILHGWIDAETRERIDVCPTHWREWL